MALADADSPMSYSAIYEATQALGYDLNSRYEPIVLLKDLGAVHRKRSLLTRLGHDLQRLVTVKRAVFLEVMHCLHYTAWTPADPGRNAFSWSYRSVCDRLWEASSVNVDRKQLASWVSERAMQQFGTKRVSFGPSSITGILHWLRALNPQVIDDRQVGERSSIIFSRRAFCSPETFALAVDYLYKLEGADYQTNVLLDTQKQEAICRLCLLEPTAFDTTLDWAVGQYDFLQRGGSGGWGSYVLLARQPRIEDFLG